MRRRNGVLDKFCPRWSSGGLSRAELHTRTTVWCPAGARNLRTLESRLGKVLI